MGSGTSGMSSGALILIVDDEVDLLEVYESLLLSEGYRVEKAGDGEEAIQKLKTKTYDLLIADIRMPRITGLELLEWAHKNQPSLKTTLVTGFANLEMTKAALDLGCEAFLAKPVDRSELIKTVRFALTPPGERSINPENFGQVPIEDFVTGKNLPYSIFVRLPTGGRFVKIAHTGEDLDLGRIYNLKAKGIDSLWLSKEDFSRYQEVSQKLAAGLANAAKISAEKRAKILGHACEIAAQKIKVLGLDQESMNSASTLLEATLTLAMDSPGAGALLEIFQDRKDDRFAHASTSAILAILVSQVMGWSNKKNILTLSLGCFFHDIGLMGLPEGLENHAREDMTEEQSALYVSHPQRGVKMIEGFQTLPKEVLLIVAQHHESGKERGFPANLAASEVFPMARIARLIDEYGDRLLTTNPIYRFTPLRFLTDLLNDPYTGNFDFTTTCALEALLETQQMAAARKQFAIAITEKRTA